MKTPSYILIFVGYVCFGVGMLLGEALGQKPLIWIATIIIAGACCVVTCISLNKPRKKKRLPRRNVRIAR